MILPRILYVSGIKDYYDYANQVQVAEEILIVISYFLFFFFFLLSSYAIKIYSRKNIVDPRKWQILYHDPRNTSSAWNNFVESFVRFVTERSEAWPLEGIVPIDVSFEKSCWEFASIPSSPKRYVDGNQVARYFDDLIIRKLYDSRNYIFICTSSTILA